MEQLIYTFIINTRKEVETEAEKQEVIDLKSVQLVKASYHEKVQPSVDELDYNSEGFEGGAGSEVAIGMSTLLPDNFYFTQVN